jgi:hypothetical protein
VAEHAEEHSCQLLAANRRFMKSRLSKETEETECLCRIGIQPVKKAASPGLRAMRWLGLISLMLSCLIWCGCRTQSARIAKVLPHYLDEDGRHTQAPSLFERDAHQAHLRTHPEEVSGLRFDVQWSSTVYYLEGLTLQLELRGTKDPELIVLRQALEKRPWYQRWTSFELDQDAFERLGEVVAWRASLWDGDNLLAEHQSFLW